MDPLDTQIEATAAQIGGRPPAPPTWRGRFGSWVIDLLRRSLWWYTAPIQQTVDLLNRRDREQSVKLLQIQEQLRSLIAASDSSHAELAEVSRVVRSRLPAFEPQLRAEVEPLESLVREFHRRIEELEQNFTRRIQELRISSAASDCSRAELAQRVTEAAHAVWGRLPVLETQLQLEIEARESLANETKGHFEDLRALNAVADSLRAEMAERVAQAAHATSDRLSALETQLGCSAESRVASLYAEFEDLFRGPREDIKERLKVYIPWLERAAAGSVSAPILDLGCGRGEWLELLSEHNFTVRGVDSNAIMIGRCKASGMEVIQADALTHLRSLPDQSLGAVTSFHMIEHLPFETVMAIVDDALRVLKSGGLLILETPNVHNLLVGSQTFWIDPTHLRPILSQTLRFFVEACGFRQVEILDLQPYPEADRLPAEGEVARWLNKHFYGPRDYSVIGRRP